MLVSYSRKLIHSFIDILFSVCQMPGTCYIQAVLDLHNLVYLKLMPIWTGSLPNMAPLIFIIRELYKMKIAHPLSRDRTENLGYF